MVLYPSTLILYVWYQSPGCHWQKLKDLFLQLYKLKSCWIVLPCPAWLSITRVNSILKYCTHHIQFQSWKINSYANFGRTRRWNILSRKYKWNYYLKIFIQICLEIETTYVVVPYSRVFYFRPVENISGRTLWELVNKISIYKFFQNFLGHWNQSRDQIFGLSCSPDSLMHFWNRRLGGLSKKPLELNKTFIHDSTIWHFVK